MPDMESVITHLLIIHTWAEFARERDMQFFTPIHLKNIAEWTDDAIELLKDQEDLGTELTNAVELIRKKNERIEKLLKEQEPVEPEMEGGGSRWWMVCGDCHGAIDDNDRYCRHCGKKIRRKTGCDGCENKGGADCALGKPGSDNAYCPNGKLR